MYSIHEQIDISFHIQGGLSVTTPWSCGLAQNFPYLRKLRREAPCRG